MTSPAIACFGRRKNENKVSAFPSDGTCGGKEGWYKRASSLLNQLLVHSRRVLILTLCLTASKL